MTLLVIQPFASIKLYNKQSDFSFLVPLYTVKKSVFVFFPECLKRSVNVAKNSRKDVPFLFFILLFTKIGSFLNSAERGNGVRDCFLGKSGNNNSA
jgi:hypothetical protein